MESVRVGDHEVYGLCLDAETRCIHYDSDRDVVAIRFHCCDRYYPCAECHAAVTDHNPEPIPGAAFDRPGVLCGVCGRVLTVTEYLDADHSCPSCDAAFNPGCAAHHDRYFAGVG